MGQYFVICNHKKREYLRPHTFGNGAKFQEFAGSSRTMFALAFLLSTDGSGQDLEGSWCGDPVGIHGDYASDGVYEKCRTKEEYRDISENVISAIRAAYPRKSEFSPEEMK